MMPYEVGKTFIIRVPLLSIETYKELCSEKDNDAFIRKCYANDVLMESIAIASTSLYEALRRYCISGNGKTENLIQSIRKFLNRAATRTTPFGLFAGVEFGNLGDKTDIELNCISQYYKRARVDMEWLSKIVIICENNTTYWNHLRFRFNSDCYEASNLMSFLKKQRENEKSPSVIDGLIEKVGMYAMEKKSVSAEQVSRNFSINSEQAENVIKQLDTIGVLGKKNEDGTHTVMMDKAAFVKRIRGYQELAERMRAVAASKNANLSDVTISKKLIIEENDHAVKTRVPGTWGEEARYVWLRKENIMEIHGGKTMLYEYMGRNLHKNRFLK